MTTQDLFIFQNLRYRAVDPASSQDLADLIELRTLCGWCAGLVPSWFESIRKGDLLYYFFYPLDGPNETGKPLGSGGLDLNLGTDGSDCSNRATQTACMVGLFVRKEHAGQGYGKQMAKFFIQLAFESYAQKTLTCINDTDNATTMKMFSDLYFKEFRRELMHHWEHPDPNSGTPTGSLRRLTAEVYALNKADYGRTEK